MNGETTRWIGAGVGSNPNDCSAVTADGQVIQTPAGSENVARDEARERIVEEKIEEEENNFPVKLSSWDEISTHLSPNVIPDAHFIVIPEQEEDSAWFFPSCNTYFLSPENWKELCEQNVKWWSERSKEMAYINDALPSPYTDPALEPLLSMVRPKVVEK